MAKEKEKQKLNLEETLKALEKDYGKGTVIGGTELESYTDVVSTGSIGLDAATGIRGLPKGKVIESYGWESSGKSTGVLHIIAEAQKKGWKCLLVDGEGSFDEKYAKQIGVKTDELLIAQLGEGGGEQSYDTAERLIRSGEIDVCVFDSQDSLKPKAVIDGEVGENKLGLPSRLLGQMAVKMNSLAKQYNCLIIFISQLREKIGVMFGNPETTSGGHALKFYSHMRLDWRKSVLRDKPEKGEKQGDAYANQTTVKVVKNKMARPFKKAEFVIIYGEGIDKYLEAITLGSELELLKKYGDKITYGEAKYTVEEFYTMLKDNPEWFEELRNKILDIMLA